MSKRVFVLGSCVTRDGFEYLPDPSSVELAVYVARTSLGSAFGKPSALAYDAEREGSPFRRRMVEIDLGKRLEGLLREERWDVLVIDFVDERFDLAPDVGGGIATVSPELCTGCLISPSTQVIRSGSSDHFALWVEGVKTLRSILSDLGRGADVYINAPFWAEKLETGGRIPGTDLEYVRRSNAYQSKLVEFAARQLECPVWNYDPESTRAASEHKWGVSPFHYEEEYYRAFCANLVQASFSR
ncbi:DUF6270 domain-containing protein [Cellulosimicrobium cellulans]|uniref:DUF6270 domain-containing protein n=1 Tax=Cellulosimicrobium cellulans TaxID=1710 RepID=UPI00382624EF